MLLIGGHLPNGKTAIAALLVGAIVVGMIGAGVYMLKSAAETRAQTQRIIDHGRTASVSDARVKVFQGSDGERRVVEMEVTFTDSDGSAVTSRLRTTPTIYVAISGPDQWENDFTGKVDIVGSQVKYLPGTPPTVELESELAAQKSPRWTFFDIFGAALCGMGALMVLGAVISVLRARRGARANG